MTRFVLLGLLVGLAALPAAPAAAQDGGAPPAASLQERIDGAAAGDTVFVEGGVFREHIVVDKPISLVGVGGPVIDGGGEGDVVTIAADDASISGFVIRGSGRSISQEPAAIKANEVDRVTIRGNRLENSHFGIYITGSHEDTIAFNTMDLGKDTPVERRGHGIYLWEVGHSVVHGNTILNAADGIHLEFSEGNGIGQNVVRHSRYGLHFMYSDSNRIIGNTFRGNLAGAVLMFSHELLLRDNELSGNWRGATGAGILLKDVDNIFAEGNRVSRNKYGMTAEGTPQSVGATAVFMRNLFFMNDTGLGLMSNAPITFVENSMVGNAVQVKALGGELATRALSTHGGEMSGDSHEGHGTASGEAAKPPAGVVWSSNGRGNYWSDYPGYDADGDGVGDVPYEPVAVFANMMDENPMLRAFLYSPAQRALDMAGRLFPIYRPKPVMTDEAPLMEPPAAVAEAGRRFSPALLLLSLLLVGGPVYAAWLVLPPRERGRRAAGLAA